MLRTKIHRPRLTTDLITRSNLIDELNRNISKPLTLVSAPAGYGKSMLISQWIEHSDIKHAWVSLDEDSNDLRTFLNYFVESIRTILPDILINIQKMLSGPALPTVKLIYEELVNALDNLEENLVVVLDDYHQIKNHEIHELLDSYLKFPPENIHLVIITRRDPPLMINQIRLYNRIFEVRIGELSFSQSEISELAYLIKQKTFSEKTIRQLLERTEGWILGLKMMLLASNEDGQMDSLSDRQLNQIHNLSKFMEEDSLRRYSEDFRSVLQHISLLDRFNTGLIDYLILQTNLKTAYTGKTFISEILERNLYVISQDLEGEWYRFHHLFHELLLHQLTKTISPQKLNSYYLIISLWFEDNAYIDLAIRYALKAMDYEQAADIVERHWHLKLNEDRWWIIKRWLDQIPEHILADRPSLLSALLFVYEDGYRFSELPSILTLFENKLKQHSDQLLSGEFFYHRGFANVWNDCNAPLALENLSKAKEMIRGEGIILRRMAFYTAVAKQMSGREHEAIDDLRQLMDNNPDSIYSNIEYAIIIVSLLSAKFNDAESVGAYYLFSMKNGKNPYLETYGNYLYANALFQKFELDRAKDFFVKALNINPFFQYRLSVDAFAGKVLSSFLTNNIRDGKAHMEGLFRYADEFNVMDIAQSCEARINLLEGNLDGANEWAKSYTRDFHMSDLQFFLEVPLITKVRICLASNNPKKIKSCLEDLNLYIEKAQAINNQYHVIDFLVLQTIGLCKIDRHQEAELTINRALELGESQGAIRPFIEPGIQMKKILHVLNVKNKHKKFIKKILLLIEARFLLEADEVNGRTINKGESIEYKLTTRELEIIHEASKGLRNKEIADNLNISIETVKNHVKNSLRKLQVSNRVELIRKAMTQKLIQ